MAAPSDAVRTQLRVAVHVGPVITDLMGLSGEAITARLLNAPILQRALAETAAHLGLIVSTVVYESVAKHRDSDGFGQVNNVTGTLHVLYATAARTTTSGSAVNAWPRRPATPSSPDGSA